MAIENTTGDNASAAGPSPIDEAKPAPAVAPAAPAKAPAPVATPAAAPVIKTATTRKPVTRKAATTPAKPVATLTKETATMPTSTKTTTVIIPDVKKIAADATAKAKEAYADVS